MDTNFMQMAAGLVAVLAAIALSAWFARRMGMGASHGERLMKVVAALPVGAKERVLVVEIGAQWMVVGVAPGRVSALATLPRGEMPAAASPAGFAQTVDFAALLRKAVRRG